MAKKEFKTTSERFISVTSPAVQHKEVETYSPIAPNIPDGYKLVRESKTDRLQLMIRPTTHAKLKKYAEDNGISKNEVINMLLENFFKNENL